MKIWLKAIRPKTLILSISPVFIGTALAAKEGTFHLGSLIFTLLTALGIQIGTNLVNDYFDFMKGADTKNRKGPVRVMQAGLVSGLVMKQAILLCFIFTALVGSYLIWKGGVIIACLISLSLLLALIYTAGPYPLAYLGLGDLFVFLFFGPIAVAATTYLQTQKLSLMSCIAGIAPGLFSSAVLIVNNLRDIEEDQKVEKKTLPVRFGSHFGRWEYASVLGIGFLCPLYFLNTHPFCMLATLTAIPGFPLIRAVFINQDPYVFNALLQKTAQLVFLYTILFCFGLYL